MCSLQRTGSLFTDGPFGTSAGKYGGSAAALMAGREGPTAKSMVLMVLLL